MADYAAAGEHRTKDLESYWKASEVDGVVYGKYLEVLQAKKYNFPPQIYGDFSRRPPDNSYSCNGYNISAEMK